MSSPVREITLMRLRETVRQPEIIFWAFVFPVLLAAVLGSAFREGRPDPIPAVVVRTDGATAAADSLAERLRREPGIRVRVLPPQEAALALRSGRADVLVTPADPVLYRYDPARSEGRLAVALVDGALQCAAGRTDPVRTDFETVTEPGSRYIDFLVPGLLGMNLLSGGLWGLGWAIVDLRMKRLLKRFTAAPLRRSDFVLGQIVARAAFVPLETAALLGLTHLLFSVPVRGSLLDLTILVALGTACFSGLGALLASRAQTMETASGLINLTQMPMLVMSGVFFATDRFPAVLQPVIQALPLTAVNDALRAVMLEGSPLTVVGGEVLVLAAWGGVSFLATVKLFRWT